MTSLIVDVGAGPQDGAQAARQIIERIQQGRDHRKQFEPVWHSSLAFASGKHWLEWSRYHRALVLPDHLKEQELVSTDVITEYRTTALGELGSDDDRPQLLLRRDDAPSETYQEQLNRAVGYGWDNEWSGDDVLDEVDQIAVDLGTGAVRVRFDKSYGPTVGDVPYRNGKPDYTALQEGPNPDVTMTPVQQGRICWEALSPFNLIVPPGVPREKDFPWECVVRPALLSEVQAEFGPAAAGLKEDGDIGSVYGWTVDGGPDSRTSGGGIGGVGGQQSRLRGYVWLFTYYERPSQRFPKGREVTLATNKLTPLRFRNELPCCGPNGDYRSGIAYHHWWRVTGRFWSRGLVDAMKDVQRIINKRETQIDQIIDRSMPFTIVQKDSLALQRSGKPGEFVQVEANERQPQPVAGVGPGQWMQQDIEAKREALQHATGIYAARLGENPGNVDTYSQLALITQNDQSKRQKIMQARVNAIGKAVEDSVHLMRTYWGPSREVTLAGDETADAAVFNATKIPPFFIVRRPKGATQPRSQAAELQKVQDIWNGAVTSQIAVQNPEWVRWYKSSLDAGEALALPSLPTNDQLEKAELENHLLLQGELVHVDYYDPPGVHIPAHRTAQNQARIAGDLQAYQAIEDHVQQHLAAAQANAANVAAAGAAPIGPPTVPGGPAPAAPPTEAPPVSPPGPAGATPPTS